jgi:phenylpropionate dioxygenase-like ring-hydroxylating dioxygenase large terminal subunit
MLSHTENDVMCRVTGGTPMGNLLRAFWMPALLSRELPESDGAPVRVRLLGEDLVAFRNTTGQVGLVAENCPHRGASLFFGRNEESGLRCVYHGWKFDRSGVCVDMPNEPPESNFKHKVKVTAYPCQERGGIVWAYMGPRDVQSEVPDLEWARVPSSHLYLSKCLQECNWVQALEGGLDSSHISFLHSKLDRSTIAAPRGSVLAEQFGGQDQHPRFAVRETDYGFVYGARRNATSDQYYWRITQWLLPFYHIIPAEDGAVVTGNAWVPIDDEHCWVYRASWHPDRPLTESEVYEYRCGGVMHEEVDPVTFRPRANIRNDYLVDRHVQRTESFSGIRGIQAQDMAMIETMGPICNRTREHLGTSDTAIISMRRRLLRLARALADGEVPHAATHPRSYRVRSAALLLDRGIPFDEGAREKLISIV